MCVVSLPSYADNNEVNRSTNNSLSLPSASRSYNYDEIHTSGGARCRQALGSPDTLEFGSIINDQGDGSVYVRYTIPLGKTPPRLHCNSLYQLELDKMRREIQMLRAGMQINE